MLLSTIQICEAPPVEESGRIIFEAPELEKGEGALKDMSCETYGEGILFGGADNRPEPTSLTQALHSFILTHLRTHLLDPDIHAGSFLLLLLSYVFY